MPESRGAGDPGIAPPEEESYDPEFFELLAEIEDRHFWFRARNQLIGAVAAGAVAGFPRPYLVLEIGCGTGNVLRQLRRACEGGSVVGMDLFLGGLRHARTRTAAPLVQGDVRAHPFRRPFDLIGMFDVLEHLADDVSTLRDLHALLRPGGKLLLTVPAHRFLWSHVDEAAHHRRRYSLDELRAKLALAGYAVERVAYFMMSILPAVWLARRTMGCLGRGKGRDAVRRELRVVPVLNSVLAFLLDLENRWVARGHALPGGTSLIAVARKGSPG